MRSKYTDYAGLKCLFLDLDGTLTDGNFHVSELGSITKTFNTKDFHGLQLLQEDGMEVVIVTGSTDFVLDRKYETLPPFCKTNLTYAKGINDKVDWITRYMSEKNLTWFEVAFMGDGDNDREAVQRCSHSACPSDALPILIQNAMYVCQLPGGKGAVAEYAYYLLDRRKKQREGKE